MRRHRSTHVLISCVHEIDIVHSDEVFNQDSWGACLRYTAADWLVCTRFLLLHKLGILVLGTCHQSLLCHYALLAIITGLNHLVQSLHLRRSIS